MRRGHRLGQRLDELDRAVARRVDQHLVEAAERGELAASILNRSATSKRCAREAVRAAFARARARPARRCPRCRSPARRARDRQREVAEAAEQVGDALAGLRRRAARSARRTSTRLTAWFTCVKSVGWKEMRTLELRQRVVRVRLAAGWNGARCPGRRAAARRGRRAVSAKLAEPLRRRRRAARACANTRTVGVLADRDLDLRQAVADRQLPISARRAGAARKCARQDLALAHVRDVADVLLAEARPARRPCFARTRTDSRARCR